MIQLLGARPCEGSGVKLLVIMYGECDKFDGTVSRLIFDELQFNAMTTRAMSSCPRPAPPASRSTARRWSGSTTRSRVACACSDDNKLVANYISTVERAGLAKEMLEFYVMHPGRAMSNATKIYRSFGAS